MSGITNVNVNNILHIVKNLKEDFVITFIYITILIVIILVLVYIYRIKNLENKERIRLLEKAKLSTKNKIESLNKSELVDISKNKLISIGSHTINHPILTKCNNETSEYEIKYSKLILENWINEPIISFAYPNGCYDDREIKYLYDNYYKIAFTTKPNYISKANKNNLFEIPRFDVLENVTSYENICRMTGVWFERKINMKLND